MAGTLSRSNSRGATPDESVLGRTLASYIECIVPTTNVDSELADGLGRLFAWSRVQYYQLISRRTGLYIDISSRIIMGALTRRGAVRASELAQVLGLEPSTVSRHISRVIAQGWATRSSDVADGRAALISLTDSGSRVRKKLWGEWEKVVREVTADWSAQERQQFLELLTRFYAGVTKSQTTEVQSGSNPRRVTKYPRAR